MPKNPLRQFARRKSSGNPFDGATEIPVPTAQSSFRVLERPTSKIINLNGDDGSQERLKQIPRPFSSPLLNLRGRSAEELATSVNRSVEVDTRPTFANITLNDNRGSGGTTHSHSSGYYESSAASVRYSSSSTLPSSVDAEREPEEDELFPRRSKPTPMYGTAPTGVDEPPSTTPASFTSRAARALAFGQKNRNNGATPPPQAAPPVPSLPASSGLRSPERSVSPHRERALTTSSYASTAQPAKVELSLVGGDFGDDFGSMFANSTNKRDSRSNASPSPPLPRPGQHRTDSQPIFPPRALARQSPSPVQWRVTRDSGDSHSVDGRQSFEGLMSSSALSSPRLDDGPPVSTHSSSIPAAFLGMAKSGYSLVPERYSSPGPESLSPISASGFRAASEDGAEGAMNGKSDTTSDEDDQPKSGESRDLRETTSTAGSSFTTSTIRAAVPVRRPLGAPPQTGFAPSSPGARSFESSEDGEAIWQSKDATPRKSGLRVQQEADDSLFDSSPQGVPSKAIRPPFSHGRTASGTPKRMTTAQFERLRRGGDDGAEQDGEEHGSDEDFDDEDEIERAKQRSKQRQKQEANMAVYRQQMKKVTGGGPSDLPSSSHRPTLDRASASTPVGAFHLGGMGGALPQESVRGPQLEDDDDDVPLGILQAHGFPGANRPPTRQGDGDPAGQRRMSVAGSVAGGVVGHGSLPPFARRLPADPFFGAGLVNQSNRESLGMSGTPSVYGGGPVMPQQQQQGMGHPAGLVGVIASEERAKAARRGSPNPVTGTFDSIPLPSNMPPHMGGMPGMPRTMSMGNLAAPQVYQPSSGGPLMMPGMMPPMMQMQGMPQDQMQQFMTMQMQLMQNMQNMLAMQQQQMTPSPLLQQQAQDYLSVPLSANRPTSLGLPSPQTPGATQGRAMTMMNPPKGWDLPANTQQRPLSSMPFAYSPSGYMSGALGPAPGYTPSIAPSERSNVGMPSRYRPVETGANAPPDAARSQSMTSSLTLQANLQPSVENGLTNRNSSTIRLIEKSKGAPKVLAKAAPVEDEDEEAWAEMRNKREEKKKARFFNKKSPAVSAERELAELGLDFN